MNIQIIYVGKSKEEYIKEACKEYIKRLSAYCSLNITEITAEQILDDKLSQKYMENEAEKILPHIKNNSFIITLEIEGKQLSSKNFAEKIKEIQNEGYNEIIFIIGGANGLHDKIKAKANYKLSFSKMTFTHQMTRVLLLEQIYRAFKINNNENYHR